MPIFCNSIKQVLAAFAFKSHDVCSPAGDDSTWSCAPAKLGCNGRAAATFEKHLALSATAPCNQVGAQLAIHFRQPVNVDRSQISRGCWIDVQITSTHRTAAVLSETDSGQMLRVHVFRKRAGIDAMGRQNFEWLRPADTSFGTAQFADQTGRDIIERRIPTWNIW